MPKLTSRLGKVGRAGLSFNFPVRDLMAISQRLATLTYSEASGAATT